MAKRSNKPHCLLVILLTLYKRYFKIRFCSLKQDTTRPSRKTLNAMWQLYCYPLCPFSRKVRLVMAEKKIVHDLVLEYPWNQRAEFVNLNPASQTPVAVNADTVLADSGAIIDYLEETIEEMPILGAGPLERAEARRLSAWFDQIFYADAGVHVLRERMWNRLFARIPPDTATLRQALSGLTRHLKYIDYLIERRRWLAGSTYSLADITAAAHLSVADYLNVIDWDKHEAAKQWYMTIKSRPSFRALLADRMPGLAPPAHYDKLDF
jgi:glutathione S-transferase